MALIATGRAPGTAHRAFGTAVLAACLLGHAPLASGGEPRPLVLVGAGVALMVAIAAARFVANREGWAMWGRVLACYTGVQLASPLGWIMVGSLVFAALGGPLYIGAAIHAVALLALVGVWAHAVWVARRRRKAEQDAPGAQRDAA